MTSQLLSLLLLCVAVSEGTPHRLDAPSARAEPVHLAVYYESLCPDSIKFVKEQLSVAWEQLQDVMDVDINAYGKATEIVKPEGGYAFICQHGSEECAGNMMLACAKKYIPDNSTYVDYNICVMSADDPPTSGEACAQQLGITYTSIASCSDSVEGEQLLHEVGLKQAELAPNLNYVPWMVENGVHTDEIQDQAEFHLVSFICSTYQGTPPPACA